MKSDSINYAYNQIRRKYINYQQKVVLMVVKELLDY